MIIKLKHKSDISEEINIVVMVKIIKNAIKCRKCGDVIESYSVHDFKFCSCESCAVDGGHDYLRRCGNLEDFEEMTVTEVIQD